MTTEPLNLVSPRKVVIQGQAQWTRVSPWHRALRTGVIAVVGGLFAVVGLIVPPHGAVTLILGALTGFAAYASWGRALFLDAVDFPCACGEVAHLDGIGAWSADLWVRCPKCAAPWRVEALRDTRG